MPHLQSHTCVRVALAALLLAVAWPASTARAESDDTWERYFAESVDPGMSEIPVEPAAAAAAIDGEIAWGRWALLNLALLALLGGAYAYSRRRGGLPRWLRRRVSSDRRDVPLKLGGSLRLSSGQNVHLVEGEGFRVLVGSWNGGMVSLGTVPGEASRDAARDVRPEPAAALPFPALLSRSAGEDAPAAPDHEDLTEQVLAQVRRARGRLATLVLAVGLGALALFAPEPALAAPSSLVDLAGMFGASEGSEWVESALFALALLTVLAMAPAMLITLTSFTRLIIVFAFLRQAMGTQSTPPNQVLIGLSLFLTFFIMAPTFEQVKELALDPYLAEEIEIDEAIERGSGPMRDFMFRQTRMQDLELMVGYYSGPRPESREQVPMVTLVPAFMISELRTAFEIGFLLYVPFLIIDLIISTILLAMGMMVLPPIIISLPFKILLFLLVDGWAVLVGSLVSGFR